MLRLETLCAVVRYTTVPARYPRSLRTLHLQTLSPRLTSSRITAPSSDNLLPPSNIVDSTGLRSLHPGIVESGVYWPYSEVHAMTQIPRLAFGLTVAGLLVTAVAFAAPQTQQSGQSSGQSQPQTQAPQQPAPPQPAPPPPAQTKAPQDQPVAQQDTVHPKNSKEDVNDIGNRNVGKGINFYSLEHEIALGKSLAQEVEKSSKLIDDPVVTEYVNRVGQNLVRNSDARVPFTIKVIDSDEVNAFALPGGFFYVNSGLILRAQEESELAGVMAHEIAHVAARHG